MEAQPRSRTRLAPVDNAFCFLSVVHQNQFGFIIQILRPGLCLNFLKTRRWQARRRSQPSELIRFKLVPARRRQHIVIWCLLTAALRAWENMLAMAMQMDPTFRCRIATDFLHGDPAVRGRSGTTIQKAPASTKTETMVDLMTRKPKELEA